MHDCTRMRMRDCGSAQMPLQTKKARFFANVQVTRFVHFFDLSTFGAPSRYKITVICVCKRIHTNMQHTYIYYSSSHVILLLAHSTSRFSTPLMLHNSFSAPFIHQLERSRKSILVLTSAVFECHPKEHFLHPLVSFSDFSHFLPCFLHVSSALPLSCGESCPLVAFLLPSRFIRLCTHTWFTVDSRCCRNCWA